MNVSGTGFRFRFRFRGNFSSYLPCHSLATVQCKDRQTEWEKQPSFAGLQPWVLPSAVIVTLQGMRVDPILLLLLLLHLLVLVFAIDKGFPVAAHEGCTRAASAF
jgi:hypothetical protein